MEAPNLSNVYTILLTVPQVIQAWYIYHKTPRSVPYAKLLLIHSTTSEPPQHPLDEEDNLSEDQT